MPEIRRRVHRLCLIAALLAASPSSARDLKVAVTIKPVHALVAAIMDGAGNPALIVDGQASPHTFSLKPSAARQIYDADIFIRVGPAVEAFSERIVATLPSGVTLVTLIDTPGLALLDRRTGASFEPHEHGAGEHHDGHDDDDHDHDAKDGHIWLDPHNAKLIADRIAATLGGLDADHAALYQSNTARLKTRLDALDGEIAALTAPLKDRPFIVFHDATQYFEARYGLKALGSVTVSPQVQPSAKRISQVRARIAQAACVFSEPYMNQRLVELVTEGSSVRSGTLDPEGLGLTPGPELYFSQMRQMALSFKACLTP